MFPSYLQVSVLIFLRLIVQEFSKVKDKLCWNDAWLLFCHAALAALILASSSDRWMLWFFSGSTWLVTATAAIASPLELARVPWPSTMSARESARYG